jgi:hypothetical protein
MWNHRFIRVLVFAASVLLLAECGDREAFAQAAPARTVPYGSPVKNPEFSWDEKLREGCSDRHWIAIAANAKGNPLAACPGAKGWSVRPLFGLPAEALRKSGLPLICLYDRKAPPRGSAPIAGGPVPDRPSPAPSAPHAREILPVLHGAVKRCAVVGPLQANSASGLTERSQEIFYHELRFQVGTTELPLTSGGSPRVRLVVIDTQPTASLLSDSPCLQCSPHGFGIAHIARDLTCLGAVCGDGTSVCAAEIATRLGLPLTGAGAVPAAVADPTAQGGYFGRPSDLALAIADEVFQWTQDESRGSQRLILNLSVGWDPELLHEDLGAEDPEGLNAEELAVYAALAYAKNARALVVAAAGNSPGGSKPGLSATLPARWYQGPPNDPRLLVPKPLRGLDPVVYAIGAVDRNDRPLANVRVQSLPPLVAYGDHAMVPLPNYSGWTAPLTGSSVSAVVASSIAAVAWHLRPDLSAEDIMRLLTRSGNPLARQADLYPSDTSGDGSEKEIRRLRFASALSWAWSLPKVSANANSFSAGVTVSTSSAAKVTLVACSSQEVWLYPAHDANNQPIVPADCPPTVYRSVSSVPWVLTQPDQDPCPSCSLASGKPPGPGPIVKPPDDRGTGTARLAVTQGQNAGDPPGKPGTPVPTSTGWLDLEIPGGWTGCLTDLFLEVESPKHSGTQRLWIRPDAASLCNGQTLRISDLPFDPSEGTASLTFRIQGQAASVRVPLYVSWK